MALNAKRICDDWLKIYNYPLYMLETFVERDRFKGTCYKAANWICTGQTKGTAKRGHDHLFHGKIKDVYLYTLRKDFRKKLNEINPKNSLSHQKPFLKQNLLSNYHFKKRFVRICPNGDIKGVLVRMITSLIDFSFIRSLVAGCYSEKGPTCYDTPSFFLLDLFRYIDGIEMSKFLKIVRDRNLGRHYRKYAGISLVNIPCEGTFSNFRYRLSEERYNEIFHVLVDIFHQLEMITFNIFAHDGTLYPSWARYKGCTYFCDKCSCITVDNIKNKARSRIL